MGNALLTDTIETITLLGIRVHLLTETRLNAYIGDVISQGRRALILNVNVHCCNIAHQYPWLKDFLNHSDITFCDGAGVMLGAKIMGHHIPERITYADWLWNLSEFAANHRYSFFFLGAKPGIADKAAQKLKNRFSGLQISTHHGYFDKSADSDGNKRIIDQINAVSPNILVLGFGMPIQEQWLKENWHKLKANIALTGGGAFDFISEELKRGPRWMTNNGLEWLSRLVIEPKRLWKRYVIGNPLFLYRVLKERLIIEWERVSR